MTAPSPGLGRDAGRRTPHTVAHRLPHRKPPLTIFGMQTMSGARESFLYQLVRVTLGADPREWLLQRHGEARRSWPDIAAELSGLCGRRISPETLRRWAEPSGEGGTG